MSASALSPEIQLADDIGSFTHRPVDFVRYAFPWKEGFLEKSPGPRKWQGEILAEIQAHLSNRETRHQPLLLAVASGHDIGKSALIAMICNWGLSTCEECKIVVTAGTKAQLETKTVPELHKWFRASINTHWWDIFATSIRFNEPALESRWRLDVLPWSLQRSDAFAGLHNLRKRIVIVFDEGSAIADKIWDVTEGVLLDEETEIIWIVFGNPTRNSGRFRDCFGKFAHRWKTRQIDSRTVEGTNKDQIARWVQDYGEDSDFVRVRVRGEFPRAGTNQFIPSDVVATCRKYCAEGSDQFPRILGVDVARFGDDQTVLFIRQGRRAWVHLKTRGLSTAQVADRVAETIQQESIEMTVVDCDGIGAPVYDQLVARGFQAVTHPFHGAAPANDVSGYFNRRAEIWGSMRAALKEGMEIPDDPELEEDLTGPEYGFSAGEQVQLEKKDDMKKRGLRSPDMGDALAMTWAVRLMKRHKVNPETPRLPVARSSSGAWMESLIPFGFPMAFGTQPHHLEPILWLIALMVMCLWLTIRMALRTERWARQLAALYRMIDGMLRLAATRVARVIRSVIGETYVSATSIRCPVLFSSPVDIVGIPLPIFFCVSFLATLEPLAPSSSLAPLPHISGPCEFFFRSSHIETLASDGIIGKME